MGKAQNNCSHCPRASLPLLHILMGYVGVRVLFLVRTVEDKKTFPFSTVERLNYAPYRFRSTVHSTVTTYVKERLKTVEKRFDN